MDNTIIFFTQIASILAYITTLFVLYRLLVSQKDATIEAKQGQIDLLKEELNLVKSKSPSALAKALSSRVEIFENELNRLLEDRERDEELIKQKEEELSLARDALTKFSSELRTALDELDEAKDTLSEFLCPHCGARLIEKVWHYELVEYQGRELDVDYWIASYECGYSTTDGKENSPCGNKDQGQ